MSWLLLSNIDKDLIIINNVQILARLVDDVNNNKIICDKFWFEPYELRNILFKKLGIDISKFDEKYFIYDSNRKIHISESENNY